MDNQRYGPERTGDQPEQWMLEPLEPVDGSEPIRLLQLWRSRDG